MAEGDSMHFNTGNRDALEWVTSALGAGYSTDYGPPGYADFVGIGTISKMPLDFEAQPYEYVLVPRPANDVELGMVALNRYMVVSRHIVNGVEVTIGGLHLEWFGDPTASVNKIVEWFDEHVSGPAIILGDFNLEPSGGNSNSPNATAWDALDEAGWVPTTPTECVKPTRQHVCKSANPTASVTKHCPFPCKGYQLDWILYKQGQPGTGTLTFVTGNVEAEPIPAASGLSFLDDQHDQDITFCSDHWALVAHFTVDSSNTGSWQSSG